MGSDEVQCRIGADEDQVSLTLRSSPLARSGREPHPGRHGVTCSVPESSVDRLIYQALYMGIVCRHSVLRVGDHILFYGEAFSRVQRVLWHAQAQGYSHKLVL